MTITLRMIEVGRNGQPRLNSELSRAVVDDDGHVTYSGDTEIMKSLFENYTRHMGISNTELAKMLNRDGWSNGYIMIDTGSK